MNLAVSLRAEARAEFDDAFDWYEGQRPGLGVAFAARVQEVFDRISGTPYVHRTVFKDVRKANVQRFPYSVLYRVEGSQVLVISVFHARRDPGIWQARA